jgi:DNA-directed RNA polymerase specialized sigma24 family protein
VKIYDEGLSPEEALQSLLPSFPSLHSEAVAASIERVGVLLTPRQRWLLSVRRTEVLPLDGFYGMRRVLEIPDTGAGPEVEVIEKEQLQMLTSAVLQLPPEDRVLLDLRFGQALTLEKIARVEGLDGPQSANRRLRDVIGRLRLILNLDPAKK